MRVFRYLRHRLWPAFLHELARMAYVYYPQPERPGGTPPVRELTDPAPGHPERVPDRDQPLPAAERELWQRLSDT